MKTNFQSQGISFEAKVSDIPTFWLVVPSAGKRKKILDDYVKYCSGKISHKIHTIVDSGRFLTLLFNPKVERTT